MLLVGSWESFLFFVGVLPWPDWVGGGAGCFFVRPLWVPPPHIVRLIFPFYFNFSSPYTTRQVHQAREGARAHPPARGLGPKGHPRLNDDELENV